MDISSGTNGTTAKVLGNLADSSEGLGKLLTRLSSGLRVSSAADGDAASLSLSTSQKSESRLYATAQQNVSEAISLVNVLQVAVDSSVNIVQQLQELANKGMNSTLSDTQRDVLNTEYQALLSEYDRIKSATTYNGMNLLDPNQPGYISSVSVQAGISGKAGSQIALTDIGPKAEFRPNVQHVIDYANLQSAEEAVDVLFSIGFGAINNQTTAQVKTLLNSDQAFLVTADGGTKDVLLVAMAKRDVGGGVMFLALEGTSAGAGNWSWLNTGVDGLQFINFHNGANPSPGLFFGAGGLVSSDFTTGANPQDSAAVIDSVAGKFGIDYYSGTNLESEGKATYAALVANSRLDELTLTQGRIAGATGRLSVTIDYVQQMKEQIGASADRVVEADVASDFAEYLRLMIVNQSATAILASANQNPLTVAKLLG